MERDSIAASFRFIDVVDELQAKLDRGERLLRPVGMVRSRLDQAALVSSAEAGAAKDRDLDVGSSVLEKLNLVLDRCLPQFYSRSFEDPDRTWHDGESAGSGCRDNPDSRINSGYDSIGSDRRGSSSVWFDDSGEESQNAGRRLDNRSAGDNRNLATGRPGMRFDEGRSSPEEEFGMRQSNSWSRLPRRESAFRSPEAHAGNYPRKESGYRIRFDEERSSSDFLERDGTLSEWEPTEATTE